MYNIVLWHLGANMAVPPKINFAALGFRCPTCSPLAVVASELTLGATACEGRGRGGCSVTQPRGGRGG